MVDGQLRVVVDPDLADSELRLVVGTVPVTGELTLVVDLWIWFCLMVAKIGH